MNEQIYNVAELFKEYPHIMADCLLKVCDQYNINKEAFFMQLEIEFLKEKEGVLHVSDQNKS